LENQSLFPVSGFFSRFFSRFFLNGGGVACLTSQLTLGLRISRGL